jgi:DNA-binding GntR family transcriptional regulator
MTLMNELLEIFEPRTTFENRLVRAAAEGDDALLRDVAEDVDEENEDARELAEALLDYLN